MSETTPIMIHTDEDILEAIRQLVRGYAPLRASRSYFTVHVLSGVVIVEGNVATGLARHLFLENIAEIPGVVAIDDSKLYDDEALRFQIGKFLPIGVRVRIDHGVVVLTGHLPEGVSLDEVKGKIVETAGVRNLTTDF